MRKTTNLYLTIICICFAVAIIIYPHGSSALTIDELQSEIERTRSEKEKLEEENKKLEQQIQETNKEANTLQSTVKALDTTQRKLQNDIKVTSSKIETARLSIEKLGIEISDRERQIENNRVAIAQIIRNIASAEGESLIEIMLSNSNVTEFWNDIENLKRLQSSLNQATRDLRNLRKDLQIKKSEDEQNKGELTNLKVELSDRETIVDQNKSVKNNLLTQTKNKEAEYKKLLERNIELGKKFEKELFEYETQLRIAIDKTKLPTEKFGVLNWPLDNIFLTQRFGATVESRRLYVSGTHNGIDFRAVMGTPVKATLGGTVKGIGNTDEQSGCYSYGRWILIEHPNGLSSLYAHLSGFRVRAGQLVSTGEIIGYSGGQPGTSGAGFSTGPHLHLTIYASEGVSIQKYSQSKFCKQVSIPIAGSNAYLDPLAYLPPLN